MVDMRKRADWTALMLSAAHGHADCVRFLIENGADQYARNREGSIALVVGARSGHVDCVHTMLDSADATQQKLWMIETDNGTIAALAAADHVEVLKMLLQAELNEQDRPSTIYQLDHNDHAGSTVILSLCIRGNVCGIRGVIDLVSTELGNQRGPQYLHELVSVKDISGCGALHHCAMCENQEAGKQCIALLKPFIDDLNEVDLSDRTALFLAAARGNAPVLELLIHLGADKFRNSCGRSPLQVAEVAKSASCQLLLSNAVQRT